MGSENKIAGKIQKSRKINYIFLNILIRKAVKFFRLKKEYDLEFSFLRLDF